MPRGDWQMPTRERGMPRSDPRMSAKPTMSAPPQPARNGRARAPQLPATLPNVLTARERHYWRIAQYVMLAVGVALVALLQFAPDIGIKIMWNVIIPVAPALVTLAPGLWRNICPMSTFSLLPRRFGLSFRIKMPNWIAAVLGVISVVALFVIVPLRHTSLNINGLTTVMMLATAASIAMMMGMFFEWRSGWCTTLCPIHPVERLYGFAPALTVKNARCNTCQQCTTPCPDSMPSMTSTMTGPLWIQKQLGNFMAGSFFGFVVGWFQVPDFHGTVGTREVLIAYAWPFGGAIVSFVIYKAIQDSIAKSPNARKLLLKIFAAAAVSTYYWYRIPALAGFDPRSGLLYDISHLLPNWFPIASHIVTTSFFFWFLVIRTTSGVSWQKRPPFAQQRPVRQAARAPRMAAPTEGPRGERGPAPTPARRPPMTGAPLRV
jgi:hypothetical protein